MSEAIRVEKRPERVTVREINDARQRFINQNLCLSPEEAGAIFGKSGKWALQKVIEGKFVAVDDRYKLKTDERGKKTVQLSSGVRITAVSVESYRQDNELSMGDEE